MFPRNICFSEATVFVALADAAQLLQLRRRRHREGATAAAAVHDTHVTDGARGGARGGGKGTWSNGGLGT